MNPIVNIILVNYNNSKDTLECIASVQNSTYKFNRIILIDNSEHREADPVFLRELLNSLDITYIVTGKNLGFAGGNNVGIREALRDEPDYVLLLNNDTIIKKDSIEKLINGAVEEKSDLSTGKIYYYDKINTIWGAGGYIDLKRGMGCLYGINQKDVGQFDKMKEILFISGCMMLIKSSVFEKIGYLDERYFMYNEDVDFCLRAAQHKLKMIYVPKSVIFHKIGAKKITKTSFYFYYYIRNSILIIRRYAKFAKKSTYYSYLLIYALLKLIVESNGFFLIPAFIMGVTDGFLGRCGNRKYNFGKIQL